MGAKCTKAPPLDTHRDKPSHSRSHSYNHAPSPSPKRKQGKPMGFAEVPNLGPTPPRSSGQGQAQGQEQGGWGLKFAEMRSHELSPAGMGLGTGMRPREEERYGNGVRDTSNSKDEKRKLARALSTKATSVRSLTSIVAKKGALKVTEVLRGAGTVGLGALDTLSSSVANLNSRGGFAAAAVAKGNKIGILAFEVANTIVKGCNLKMTLGEEDIRTLKEEVLVSEGVQRLVSSDPDELLLIAASDKRNELKVFTDEVVRFGNHCKDPLWHGYDRVFRRLFKETEITDMVRISSVEADKIMDDLMNLAQNTADLYHELHALDRFRIDLKRKQQEEEAAGANARGGETVALLKSEVKSQEKHVEGLKKKSLWSRTLEEVMEQLVDISNFLYQEIYDHFGPQVFLEEPEQEKKRNTGKLGSSGLALHYANLINQIDTLVQRPGSVPPNTRDNLYQGLPPSVKIGLRARLQNGTEHGLPLNGTELKGDLDQILNWLVPVATNTTKAHHGFGWVGEWANTGSPADRRAMGYVEITLIQTLHHANQRKVENYILDLTTGLHHLVSMAKANLNGTATNYNVTGATRSPARLNVKPAILPEPFVPSDRSVSPPPFAMFSNPELTEGLAQYSRKTEPSRRELSQEEREMLRNMGSVDFTGRKLLAGLSKSQEFDNSGRVGSREFLKLSKSSSQSQASAGGHPLDAPLYRPRNRVKPLGVHRLDEMHAGTIPDGVRSERDRERDV